MNKFICFEQLLITYVKQMIFLAYIYIFIRDLYLLSNIDIYRYSAFFSKLTLISDYNLARGIDIRIYRASAG